MRGVSMYDGRWKMDDESVNSKPSTLNYEGVAVMRPFIIFLTKRLKLIG